MKATRYPVLRFAVGDKNSLHQAYMPWVNGGGLFLPLTNDSYSMGDHVYLLLSLPDDKHLWPVHGIIGWLTPKDAQRGSVQGIGLVLQADSPNRATLVTKIEAMLASLPKDKKTLTL